MNRLRGFIVKVLCGGLLFAGAPVQAELMLILPESMKLESFDSNVLAKLYTGRTTRIEGDKVRPLNLKLDTAAAREFVRQVLNLDPFEYARQWQVKQYSGRGVPPKQADSAADLYKLLAECESCTAYLDSEDAKGLSLPNGYKLIPFDSVISKQR